MGVREFPAMQMVVTPRIFNHLQTVLPGPVQERIQGTWLGSSLATGGTSMSTPPGSSTVFNPGGCGNRNGLKEEKVVKNVGKVGKVVMEGLHAYKLMLTV